MSSTGSASGLKKRRSESLTPYAAAEAAPTTLKKGTWSEDEHDRLVAAVQEYGTDGPGAWQSIQQYVGTRDVKQLKDRYKLKLDESFTSSEWTKQEDALLLAGVDLHGQKWTRIAYDLPGRNENAIKTRYHTLQRREQKIWTAEEESLLRNLLEHQVSFEDICRCFPKKTSNMIATRRDNFAMEIAARTIKQQLRATSPDDFNSALRKVDLQPFTATTATAMEEEQEHQTEDIPSSSSPRPPQPPPPPVQQQLYYPPPAQYAAAPPSSLFPQQQQPQPTPELFIAAPLLPPPLPPIASSTSAFHPPHPESPSSRRFRFTRKSSERMDGNVSPLHFAHQHTHHHYRAGGGGNSAGSSLDFATLDDSFLSILQKMQGKEEAAAHQHPLHHHQQQPQQQYAPQYHHDQYQQQQQQQPQVVYQQAQYHQHQPSQPPPPHPLQPQQLEFSHTVDLLPPPALAAAAAAEFSSPARTSQQHEQQQQHGGVPPPPPHSASSIAGNNAGTAAAAATGGLHHDHQLPSVEDLLASPALFRQLEFE